MSFKTISVIGLGYIGLPTAAVIASRGHRIVGVDVNATVVETINRGEIHIVEPGLEALVNDAVSGGLLSAHCEAQPADAFLIAVPTPIRADTTSDLSYVLSAGRMIAPVLKPGDLVILESTSPVGSTERLAALIADLRPDLRVPAHGSAHADIRIAYCPERVLPGKVIEELVSNDRSIGGLTPACTQAAIDLYSLFVDGELVPTDTRSAELCKLAENAFRDVNIAYANELANVCDHLEMNVWEVIRLANRHPRVNILQPGPGVGGHCIAVDPWFIAESAPDDTPLIQAARHVNDGRPDRTVDRIRAACARTGKRRPAIALLGLAFKPNIDDLRGSPAITVARAVLDADLGEVVAVEPNVEALPDTLSDAGLRLAGTDAVRDADVVVLLVDHREFGAFSLADFAGRELVDMRGLYEGG